LVEFGRVPPPVFIAGRFQLRRDQDEGRSGMLRDDLGRAVTFDRLDIGAALARSMKEDDQRPLLRLVGILAARF